MVLWLLRGLINDVAPAVTGGGGGLAPATRPTTESDDMKTIWDERDGDMVQVAGPMNSEQRAEFLASEYGGQECGIIHGGDVTGCDADGAENIMIIPADKTPDDYLEL